MSKREYGTGGISKRGSGYAARMRLADGGRVSLGTHRTEDEAQRALAGARKALSDGTWVTPGGLTLRDYGERWVDRREIDGVHRSVDRERSLWQTHILSAPFIDEPLGGITKLDVRRWVKGLAAKPVTRTLRTKRGVIRRSGGRALSRGTVKHARDLLSSCFEGAVEEELLADNPLRGVRVPKDVRVQRKNSAWTYLEHEEIAMLETSDAVPEDARAVFLTAAYVGLRKGELWGLKWEDVMLEGTRPHVVVRRSHDKTTKNGEVRCVPLLPRAVEVLSAWRQIAPSSRAGWVFARKDGSQRKKHDTVGWNDRRSRHGSKLTTRPGLKTKAGICRKVRFHDLRHYADLRIMPCSRFAASSAEEARLRYAA